MSVMYVSKEEYKRQKKLNKSLSYTGRDVQAVYNIFGFHSKDFVINNGNGKYICIFEVKLSSLKEVNSLISILCVNLTQRFRITSLFQNDDKMKFSVYLSIILYEKNYYKVHDELEKIKNELIPSLANFGFFIKLLDLNEIAEIWSLYRNFEYIPDINFKFHVLLRNMKFKDVNFIDNIVFEFNGYKCCTLKIIDFNNDFEQIPVKNFQNFDRIFVGVDLRKYSDVEADIYNKMLNVSYNYKKELNVEDLCSFSGSFVFMCKDINVLKRELKEYIKICSDNGLYVVTCNDESDLCFSSLGSFGIQDYTYFKSMLHGNLHNLFEEL